MRRTLARIYDMATLRVSRKSEVMGEPLILDVETMNYVTKRLSEKILKYPVPPEPGATPETIAASNALMEFMQELSE